MQPRPFRLSSYVFEVTREKSRVSPLASASLVIFVLILMLSNSDASAQTRTTKQSGISPASKELGRVKEAAIESSATTSRAESERSDESVVGEARGELSTTIGQSSNWRKASETKFAYKLRSAFESFANEKEQSQFFGLGVGGDFKAQLLPALSFRAKGGAIVTSGYAQSRFGDNVGRSGFYVEEAALTLRALDSRLARAYLAGGALDQGQLGLKLLVDDQAFPGAREMFVFGSTKDARLRIWAQQTIPTSKTLSTKTVDAEVTPTFMTETAELTISPMDSLELRGFATHFAFNSLPSAVALESVIYGNTVNETGPNTAKFKYGFEGIAAGGGATVKIARGFSWTFLGNVIQNMQAPEGYRNAQYLETNMRLGLPGDIDLVPAFAMFFTEDDVAPGFYNSSVAGHNNRQGYSGGMEVFFQKQRFKVRAEYIDADTINFNVNQSRHQSFKIGFETFYELF